MAEIISLEILLKWRLVFSFLAILLNLWTGRWDWLVLVRLKKLRSSAACGKACELQWGGDLCPCWATCLRSPSGQWAHACQSTFSDTETQFLLQTKENILATGLSVVSALCFSPFFSSIFFFCIAIPFPFGRSLSSILFLSKWRRAVEQMMALWESGVVMRDVWCVYSTTESKNTQVLLCIANARVSREDTWWWCLVFTLGKLWVQEGPLQMCWNLENRNKVGWEWREERVEKTRC